VAPWAGGRVQADRADGAVALIQRRRTRCSGGDSTARRGGGASGGRHGGGISCGKRGGGDSTATARRGGGDSTSRARRIAPVSTSATAYTSPSRDHWLLVLKGIRPTPFDLI
jgi:hypothetical protein